MKTANLRHLITVQQPATTRSASGGVSTTFTTPGVQVWAEVLPEKGREFFAGKAQQNEEVVAFRIRYSTTARENCRVVFNNLNHHVVSAINERGLNKFTLLYCVANLNEKGN